MKNAAVISVGSDGTDGPTDAAGGYVDGDSFDAMKKAEFDLHEVLQDNDAYHALQAIDGLIATGPTGTNVNDISVALLNPEIPVAETSEASAQAQQQLLNKRTN